MGLTCRCQALPKGSPGRPCEKCKANNKRTNAKAMASGAQQKAVLKYKRSEGGKQAHQKAVLNPLLNPLVKPLVKTEGED